VRDQGINDDELAVLYPSDALGARRQDEGNVVDEILRLVGDVVACERALLFLREGDSDHMRAYTLGGGDARIPMSGPSIIQRVYRSGQSEIVNDAGADPDVYPSLAKWLEADQIAAVPLKVGLDRLGVLAALDSERGGFVEKDLRLLTLLADRTALSIENAQLRAGFERQGQETEFVSTLAHELSGPMAAIKGFGRALEESWDELPEERRSHFLQIVTTEIDRLSRLVSDLLDVSQMETGTLRYELEPFVLPELVRSILTVHTSLGSVHRLETDIPDDLSKVMGDRDRIEQVVLNLLSNARRYSPKGTTITIVAEVSDKEVEVSVSDEGIGIAPEDQERVFSKFVMLPKPSWVKKGTGLGLFISKEIVEAHGGRIWVTSESGKGSTFHFTLRTA
jgi:signal transduction histidine kinase